MNFTEAQKNYEIYLHDDFKISLFIIGSQDCCFKHFSLDLIGEQAETVNFDIKDG
jgi:hypothetical protein